MPLESVHELGKVLVLQVRCPEGHKLPVWVPPGVQVEIYCRRCGRMYAENPVK